MKIVSFTLLIISTILCIYYAAQNNMFCVVWALNANIHLSNYKELRK
jgi:hypothetical protein